MPEVRWHPRLEATMERLRRAAAELCAAAEAAGDAGVSTAPILSVRNLLSSAIVALCQSPPEPAEPATNEELLRQTRENAAEMAVRSILQRQFGNYHIDGARGTIRSTHAVAPAVNYRELAHAALAHADLIEGRPLRGAKRP